MNRVLILVTCIISIIISSSLIGSTYSNKVFLTSCAIQVLAIVGVFSREEVPYSLKKIFYLFCFFFFGIAPVAQYLGQTSAYGARVLKENEFFYTNCIIIVIMILYEVIYNLTYKFEKANSSKKLRMIERFNIVRSLSIQKTGMVIFLSLISFYIVFYFQNFNIFNLLLRGGELVEVNEKPGSSVNLIVNQALRPLSMMCLLYYLNTKKKNYIVVAILTILSVITIFPLGVPRFYAAALYIPLLLTTVSYLKMKNVFSITFVFGMLIIFPFLDTFRAFGRNTELKFSIDYKMFQSGHFDSFQNFAFILSEEIITYGYQLLGVLFFWVPRAVWPGKPVGSGELIAEIMQFEWNNVSANFFAEGYVNFGFFGILAFVFLLARYTAVIDKIYWVTLRQSGPVSGNFFRILYYIMLGMLFFILRGDLLSSFAFTIGFMISYFVVYKLIGNTR